MTWKPQPPGCVGAMGAPISHQSNAHMPCQVCQGYGFMRRKDAEFPYRFDKCANEKCGGSGQIYLNEPKS